MGTQTLGTTTTWAIDPGHTHAEFAIKHMVFATARGRFKGVSGTISLDEQDPTASSVEVAIEVGSIDTSDDKRDGHLKSPDFFDVERFPLLTFKSTAVTAPSGDDFEVHGDLTIRDVTRPVVLKVERLGGGKSPFGTEVMAYAAKTTINRKDFGLTWNMATEAGGLLVGEEVKISLDIETVKQ